MTSVILSRFPHISAAKCLPSSSRFSSRLLALFTLPDMPGRSMEEVWKDISLSTLHQEVPSTPLLSFHHHHRTFRASNTTTASFGGIITLEDFLAAAPKEATPFRPPASIDPSPDHSVRFFGYDLNASACDCKSSASSFDAHSECTKKRLPEQRPNRSNDRQDGAERRKKRIIKNRESAARSRARKQVTRRRIWVHTRKRTSGLYVASFNSNIPSATVIVVAEVRLITSAMDLEQKVEREGKREENKLRCAIRVVAGIKPKHTSGSQQLGGGAPAHMSLGWRGGEMLGVH
ncbi:hypothetical protein GW17_00027474 [Ensete ventricosum]|nr:hypothetical protein GW17_00027474 [Ensete ventricosum]